MPRSRSLRADAGQLLVCGFEGPALQTSTREMLRHVQPAGVMLFARNIESPAQTHALLHDCRAEVSAPLFRCVDMEGGTVDRFKRVLAPSPSAAAVFATGKRKNFRRHGQLIGEACRALGFNVDFAPALDLALVPSRAVLGSRVVSPDPKKVTAYATEFLRGLSSAGVLGCGKHFPGLGEAALDTHFQLPSVFKSWNELWKHDLVPYRRLYRALPFILVAHALYPEVASDGPASLSPHWITTVLRQKIGYRGLIATDDMEMQGVLAAAPIEEAAVRAIAAGADLLLICRQEDLIVRAYEAMVRAAENDSNFSNLVEHSARRVLAFKRTHGRLTKIPPSPKPAAINRLREQLQDFTATIESANARQSANEQMTK
ncbi:MAG TPA: beta-N-acetylhexosaminidase [Candidatus Binataceae bacterium]|nr:beta-N-acetylhexosaminidase [Candidatus Binataceae bacterium]